MILLFVIFRISIHVVYMHIIKILLQPAMGFNLQNALHFNFSVTSSKC